MNDFETHLKETIKLHLQKADGEAPRVLIDSISYSLLSPGKRTRPKLSMAVGHLLGLSSQPSLTAATSVEALHCASLIHDDLPCMDNDDYRRGLPTNHRVYGNGIALLAGVSLLYLAVEILLEAKGKVSDESLLRAIRRLVVSNGACGMIAGQAEEFTLNETRTLSDLQWIQEKKTGMLFETAIMIPFDLSGLSEDSHDAKLLGRFSKAFGLAFQALDDVQDWEQDLRKPSTSDSSAPNATKNLRHYLSLGEINTLSLDPLRNVSQEIYEHWGEAAEPLKTIVVGFLERARIEMNNALNN